MWGTLGKPCGKKAGPLKAVGCEERLIAACALQKEWPVTRATVLTKHFLV